MSPIIGHLWSIQWGNPYTRPAKSAVLAEIFVPIRKPDEGARLPNAIADHTRPAGYALCCASIVGVPRRLSVAERGRMRVRRLEARERQRHPMFAEQFVAERLVERPMYYAGYDEDDGRDELYRQMEERVAYLWTRANQLIEYSAVGSP